MLSLDVVTNIVAVSRNTGLVTRKSITSVIIKGLFLRKSIPKMFYLYLKTKSLVTKWGRNLAMLQVALAERIAAYDALHKQYERSILEGRARESSLMSQIRQLRVSLLHQEQDLSAKTQDAQQVWPANSRCNQCFCFQNLIFLPG